MFCIMTKIIKKPFAEDETLKIREKCCFPIYQRLPHLNVNPLQNVYIFQCKLHVIVYASVSVGFLNFPGFFFCMYSFACVKLSFSLVLKSKSPAKRQKQKRHIPAFVSITHQLGLFLIQMRNFSTVFKKSVIPKCKCINFKYKTLLPLRNYF